MIHAELIMTSRLGPDFHRFAEELNGVNPASVVQAGKKPRSTEAYLLAYFKAFSDANSDTSEIHTLFGMMHFGMLCAGPEIDIAEVSGWPHGLRCLQGPVNRHGGIGIIMTGDGNMWRTSIQTASWGIPSVVEWGSSCLNQFNAHNLGYLIQGGPSLLS